MSVEGPESGPRSDNPYQQLLGDMRKQRRLFSVHWELTYRCNERCTHCYLDVLKPNAPAPGELNTEQCLAVIDQLAELGVMNLSLSGGEAMVRKDFFTIAEYARSKRFVLRIFTNGLLINAAAADRIAALHPYAVEISLYGADAATHDAITLVPRSFELTLRAFRLLQERGVRTNMKVPLMHENVRQLHQLAALAAGVGAILRTDPNITPKLTGERSPLRHRLTDEDLLWLTRETMNPAHWPDKPPPLDAHTCGISQLALVIDPHGDVFPCVEVRVAAGNVLRDSLATVWRTSPVFQEMGRLTVGELPVCRSCPLRAFCTRCHGLALNEEGDLRLPALANCRATLVRRQVLVERGVLPANYPVPAHLQPFLDGQVHFDDGFVAQAPAKGSAFGLAPGMADSIRAPIELFAGVVG
jgi:radical SAM protein with 4Fe4S-binding SPASM domain